MARGFEFDQATGTFKDIPDEQPNNSAASFWERPKTEDLERAPPPPEEPKKPFEPKRKCTRFLSNSDPQPQKEETTKPEESKCPLTKEQRATKPSQSKDPDKWYNKGGKISIDENKTWTYTDWEDPPHTVSYPGGYPDFKAAGMVKKETTLENFEGWQKDFAKADKKAGKIDYNVDTWHHNEDGKTMQAMDKFLHKRFTHRGGMSIAKKEKCEN